MLSLISSVLLILFMVVVIVSLLFETKTHIPPVPTLPWVKLKIITLLCRHRSQDTPLKIAELGSGWGGVCFSVAKTFPKSHVIGYEISPFPYYYSKIRKLFSRKHVTFTKESFFEADLSEFDVIICYLSPKHMEWLKDKFETELKPNTLIISNAFPIPDSTPIEEDMTHILVKIPVYIYKVA